MVNCPSLDATYMANNRLQYLTANDWILVTAKAKRLTFRLGEEIIKQGALGDTLIVVRSGEASVELAGANSTVVVAKLGPEDICGDMAFLEKSTATAAVIAKDELVEVDAIRGEDLRKLFESFPGLGTRFYRSLALVLARRLRETSKRLAGEKAAYNP
jgi:CRP/FNR family transcriptional regulator, cyclic AMP receptor protein